MRINLVPGLKELVDSTSLGWYALPRFLLLLVCSGRPSPRKSPYPERSPMQKQRSRAVCFRLDKGETIGTITNAQGDFDFHIPAELSQKTLVISMLGYRSFESTVSALHVNEPLLVALESSTQLLNEVVIRDSLTGGDILQRALARLSKLSDGTFSDGRILPRY